MKKLLDPGYWLRALSRPIVLIGLLVDLLPIYAVIAWGWGAAPLVLLYWIENVLIGVMTIPRIVISGATFGMGGLLAGLLMSAFFVFHYGLFCAVHGTFLMAFISFSSDPPLANSAIMMDMPGMIRFGLDSGMHAIWIVGAIFAFQIIVFCWDFILRGGWKTTNPANEMFAPYGRIVVLHFAIFAGAGALFLLGQPMVGVLALILLRAVWGIVTNAKDPLEDPRLLQSRETFEKMLQGKAPEPPASS